MIPKTALETAVHASKSPFMLVLNKNKFVKLLISACLFPFYMNRAAMETNPLERFKFVVTTTISSFYFTNTFLKPVIDSFF